MTVLGSGSHIGSSPTHLPQIILRYPNGRRLGWAECLELPLPLKPRITAPGRASGMTMLKKQSPHRGSLRRRLGQGHEARCRKEKKQSHKDRSGTILWNGGGSCAFFWLFTTACRPRPRKVTTLGKSKPHLWDPASRRQGGACKKRHQRRKSNIVSFICHPV